MSDDGIQFESAEFGPEGRGASTCSGCRERLAGQYWTANGHPVCATCQDRLATLEHQGSPLGRFLRAGVLGLGGALLGAGIWFAVIKLTGYQVGLIAIVVGFLVGKGVAMGAGGRGGWAYQSLAMVLTYLAIVSTYVPMIVAEAPEDVSSAAAWLTAALIAIPAPFLAGFQNLIGLLIIGIALYEAFKLNSRRVIAFTGPHALGPTPEPVPPPAAPSLG